MVNPPNFDLKFDLKSEEARIKLVYAQRQGSGRYSWFNHGYIFRIQGLERDLLARWRACIGTILAVSMIRKFWRLGVDLDSGSVSLLSGAYAQATSWGLTYLRIAYLKQDDCVPERFKSTVETQ